MYRVVRVMSNKRSRDLCIPQMDMKVVRPGCICLKICL